MGNLIFDSERKAKEFALQGIDCKREGRVVQKYILAEEHRLDVEWSSTYKNDYTESTITSHSSSIMLTFRNPFDALADHAIREHRKRRTRNIRDLAKEWDVDLDIVKGG
jgi:hypothetical protein|tara:strand:+ start:2755 stop:3081 length:327 start_codon:yes stop_codon:yes gene_type:complete